MPVISAIIERGEGSEKEILIQTRIAEYDKDYHGTIEIPAGKIDRFENIYETIRREVEEETGLTVTEIFPKPNEKTYTTSKNDKAFVFQPYFCQQLLKGNTPWIGFVFLCKAEGELRAQETETADLRWVKLEELKKLLETPDKIFTLQLPVLHHYLELQK